MNKQRRSWQENLVLLTDIVIIAFCYVAAYFIRFDGIPSEKYIHMMLQMLPIVLVARLAALFYFKLHKSIWHYASVKDLIQIIKAVSISSVFIVASALVFNRSHPRSIFVIDWLLLIIALSGARFVIRLTRPVRWAWQKTAKVHKKRVLIVGAGDAGEMLLREIIYRYGNTYEVIGLVDDSPRKFGRHIHGVSVLGNRTDIPDIVKDKRVDEIILAIPSISSEGMRDILQYCIKSGARYRTVPKVSDLPDGTVKIKQLREIKLEDLLERDEALLDKDAIERYIRGKNVLITGAGGSIGSELARQVAGFGPRTLVLFEKAENPLFYINMELDRMPFKIKKHAIIGDICDRERVKEVFKKYKPDIIFHAAAHKHVPLMEENSTEAVKNNIFGTKVLAEESVSAGVEKFIMLSTDKAVDPVNVMGASKRMTETLMTTLGKTANTQFIAVRFGNVLGSEGSVIPTFKKQIEKGGPITVTHPEIKRYFMTIPEAAGLVMQAGLMGRGGEIFILEMGTQIKVVDIAVDLIRLAGLEPHKDIKIVLTGLRQGEKMHESLTSNSERLVKTYHNKINVVESNEPNPRNIFEDIKTLEGIINKGSLKMLVAKLEEMVYNYRPSQDLLTSIYEEHGPQANAKESIERH
ncbi:polysaccharide biosynthesis protein [Candidatus Omnitrophota bacterium]